MTADEQHLAVIKSFLTVMNKVTDQFILKGGTSLKLCYGLDRFSEDIDLDGTKQNIKEIVRRFCQSLNFSVKVAKDTPTVTRCIVDYGNSERKLKIEVSYRNAVISEDDWQMIDGIRVYTIDRIAQMKCAAYSNRDKIRDLYDLSFICNNHFDKLSHTTLNLIRDTLSFKGIEQFDYVVKTQDDPLIDKEKLAEDFLSMHDKLGLLVDSKSKSPER